ncbi:hypothetical protein [Bacillus cereus group sp. TH152-1LC]|uniref:hypothetical protein n=1 Tax=Bacillus cereus group sp. TH152-1LC TaxID=3018060 RepID=UPI0022E39623|nr:hypothetical protein [Bacillus cereus group sp. TH152-1LC]MDA1675388.1 hypothetical protein [Bacillus cereus group sp. TH152-1LC]
MMDKGSQELLKKIKIPLIIFLALVFITTIGSEFAKNSWEHPDYVFQNNAGRTLSDKDAITLEQGTYTLYFNKTSAFQERDNYKISILTPSKEENMSDFWEPLPMKKRHMDSEVNGSRIQTMYVVEIPKTDIYLVRVETTQELTSEEQIATFNMKSGNMFFSNMIVWVSILGFGIFVFIISRTIFRFVISGIRQNIAEARKDHDNESK